MTAVKFRAQHLSQTYNYQAKSNHFYVIYYCWPLSKSKIPRPARMEAACAAHIHAPLSIAGRI